jgi:hypothetical protein
MPVHSYNRFVFFIYLTLADIDGKMKFSEINVLFDKLDPSIFDETTHGNELVVDSVFKEYKSQTHEQRLETIRKAATVHKLTGEKAEYLLQNLQSIVDADGHQSEAEKKMDSGNPKNIF